MSRALLNLPTSSRASLERAVARRRWCRCGDQLKCTLATTGRRNNNDESTPQLGHEQFIQRKWQGIGNFPAARSAGGLICRGDDVHDLLATCGCASGASNATPVKVLQQRGYCVCESSDLSLPLLLISSQQQHRDHHRHFHSSTVASRQRGEYYKLRHHKKAAEVCPFQVLGLDRRGTNKREGGRSQDQEGSAPDDARVSAVNEATAELGSSKDTGDYGVMTYRAVKTAFLKIAMAHHPDTTEAETQEEMDAHRDIFIRAREAFEMIVPGPDGVAILRSESPEYDDEPDDDAAFDVDAWFQSETGHAMPFMDLQTMREVAKMTETVGHGLDRDGGMWLLAEMVSDNVKKGGGDGMSLLRLEAGDVANNRHVDGVLRRRRRRDR